ncbi:MAG: EAL domain-containing protein [Ruminococcus sp.]|nr:EAL domain-containing protein [Ruminococcus sp.]
MRPDLFHIAFYASALLILATTIFFTVIQQRTAKLNNKLFLMIAGLLSLNAISQIIAELSYPHRFSDSWFLLINVSEYIYFMLHAMIPPLVLVYVNVVTGASTRYGRVKRIIYELPLIVAEATLFLNPFLHWFFYYDENREFCRGYAESTLYLSAGFYLTVCLFTLVYTWKAVVMNRRIAIIYFFTVCIAGILVQLFFLDVKAELFAESVGLLGIMIAVETEDDRIDVDTGFYNRRALQLDLNNYLVNKRELWVMCIKVTNADIIPRVTGSENVDILSTLMSNYLRTKISRSYIYNMNPQTFVLTILDKDEEAVKSLATEILVRFDMPWTINDNEYLLKAVIMFADVPKRLPSSADAFYMADSPVPEGNDKKILCGSDLNYLLRRSAIQNAIVNGLKKDSFEVYYQPTFNLSDGSLHGAEALLRLDDETIGRIPPYEFIPISEQMGLVDVLDTFVLGEVCKLLSTELKNDTSIEAINVNLSVLQCMKPGFVQSIDKEADKYGIDRSRINFEITESVAASDYDQLSQIVSELKRSGFRFSLDDYGTGYSNVMSVFSMDLDIIKIDKSILWTAVDHELGRILLENTVRMIKQMGRKVLVEGVETKAQLDLLRDVGVDYLQGFYFSRPLPREEFLALVANEKQKIQQRSKQ